MSGPDTLVERLHGWLAGTFTYTAYRGRAPEGVPQLRSDVRIALDELSALRERFETAEREKAEAAKTREDEIAATGEFLDLMNNQIEINAKANAVVIDTLRAARDEAVAALELAAGIVRDGLDAASAAYEQAQAEYQDHDKTAERKDAIVRNFRNAARAFLAARSLTQPGLKEKGK